MCAYKHPFLKRRCDSAADIFGDRLLLRLEARLLVQLHSETAPR